MGVPQVPQVPQVKLSEVSLVVVPAQDQESHEFRPAGARNRRNTMELQFRTKTSNYEDSATLYKHIKPHRVFIRISRLGLAVTPKSMP